MNLTYYDRGLIAGCLQVVRVQLEARFGPLSVQVQERLKALSADQLIELSKAVLRVNSLRELSLED